MHYFKHHIGDYRRDTQHLTLLEHGVYRQLIDQYHLDEKPLTGNLSDICRRLGARSEDEKSAVNNVLKDFFYFENNEWNHKRCDQDLEEYHAKSLINKENGKKGGRPKKNPEKTHPVSFGNPEITDTGLTINHKPLTNNLSLIVINIDWLPTSDVVEQVSEACSVSDKFVMDCLPGFTAYYNGQEKRIPEDLILWVDRERKFNTPMEVKCE